MPEYLSPGVYVEEVSYRAKFIEGVSTSTCGVVGQTSFGPVSGRPDVVTSFSEFARRYGGFEDLLYAGGAGATQVNYTAHAAHAFFDNGGQRLYVARVFKAGAGGTQASTAVLPLPNVAGKAWGSVQARYPGSYGNQIRVLIGFGGAPTAGANLPNILVADPATPANGKLNGVYPGAVVVLSNVALGAVPAIGPFFTVTYQNAKPVLLDSTGAVRALASTDLFGYLVELSVAIFVSSQRSPDYAYSGLAPSPAARNFIGSFFDQDQPGDADAPVAITQIPTGTGFVLASFLPWITGTPTSATLAGGDDGAVPNPGDYQGVDDEFVPTALAALEHLDDIALVMAPDAAAEASGSSTLDHQAVNNFVIAHCEKLRYRFAVLDEPVGVRSGAALDFRSKFDTTYAGIYYPWVKVSDPRIGKDGKLLLVPPSGFVSGICARTDIRRGVWKAPANEVVLDAIDFEFHITKGVQDVLNPRGVNCLRFFEEGGFRVWGARTVSSDPEWKYVNVRRLFIFLEHSIDKGTQWVVFEPNNEATWANVRHTIVDFLFNVWKQGALMGTKPEDAFFVRCDRSTMTQNDLDNGRLVCQIGVAPATPAEFVIFRIGQWTADAKTS
jgi:phage tail sheath protein FI